MHVRLSILAIVAICSAALGCSTSPEALQESGSAARAEKNYSENYQEIYRRVAGGANRCSTANMSAYSSFKVDAQLYNELGFGEVNLSLQNFGTHNYYWQARIEKSGSGSKLKVVSGNSLGKGIALAQVVRWADGGQGC